MFEALRVRPTAALASSCMELSHCLRLFYAFNKAEDCNGCKLFLILLRRYTAGNPCYTVGSHRSHLPRKASFHYVAFCLHAKRFEVIFSTVVVLH